MFELSSFYKGCRENDISVIPFDNAPSAGTTARFKEKYAIFLDFSALKSVRKLRGTCMHEMGHAETGALHKVHSPYETIEHNEHIAVRWTAEHFLTVDDFMGAFRAGYTETWELAEYFDLPEEDIKKALHYWTECRGIDFNSLR